MCSRSLSVNSRIRCAETIGVSAYPGSRRQAPSTTRSRDRERDLFSTVPSSDDSRSRYHRGAGSGTSPNHAAQITRSPVANRASATASDAGAPGSRGRGGRAHPAYVAGIKFSTRLKMLRTVIAASPSRNRADHSSTVAHLYGRTATRPRAFATAARSSAVHGKIHADNVWRPR